MEIKTKHDLEAKVWVLHKSKARQGKITEISISSGETEPLYKVEIDGTPDFCLKYESETFAAKEHLLTYVATE